MTPDELRSFQQNAVDWRGSPLAVDAVLGPRTAWALDLRAFGSLRERVVRIALGYLGTTESPPGSNRGALVDQFLAPAGLKGQPWCAAFVSYVRRQCGCLPGAYHVSVHNMAKAERPPLGRVAWPGDVFYILRPDGTGHCGFVIGGSDHEIMTVEGNCNNAVRVGRRDRARLSGYIDVDPGRLRLPLVAGDVPDLDGEPDR
jgi:hypothetical protein